MITLTYGLKKPQTGDKGSTFFPALEDNIDLLDSHDHDGVNSAKLQSSSVNAISQTVASGSWADQGGGIHRALVTMPSPLEFDTCTMNFEIASGADIGARFFPSYEKVSTNTFYVYINDNSVDIKVIYS